MCFFRIRLNDSLFMNLTTYWDKLYGQNPFLLDIVQIIESILRCLAIACYSRLDASLQAIHGNTGVRYDPQISQGELHRTAHAMIINDWHSSSLCSLLLPVTAKFAPGNPPDHSTSLCHFFSGYYVPHLIVWPRATNLRHLAVTASDILSSMSNSIGFR